MRFAMAVVLLLLGLRAVVRADDANVARCGSRKIAVSARACRDFLRAEARYLRNNDAAARAARVAAVTSGLIDGWARAEEQAAGDVRCSADTADAAAAATRLAAAVSVAAAGVPGSTECRRTLVGLWAPLCRITVATERAAVKGDAAAAAVRAAAVARVRERLAARWPAPRCAGGASSDAAATTLLGLASGAAGDATTRGLRALGGEADIKVGAAVEPDEVTNDPAYAPVLARDIGSLTAENAMKWGVIHPQPDQWVFAPADEVVALAEARGQRVRGHTLIWGALQLPAYVSGAATAAELRGYMADHMATLMGRYVGRIAQWDVVNEPLSGILDPPTPDGLDDNVFHQLLGPGYIEEALRLARAADPRAKLYMNENGIEVPGPRQDRFYALVQDLLTAGAPLDGIGFQAHLGLIPPAQYPDRAVIEASLRRFADLGLEVELTELDVTLVFRSGDQASRFAFQGDYYRSVVAACLAVPACSGITTWGVSDRYTWLRTFFGFTDWPLPFDDAWARKPAYFGMRAALLQRLLSPLGS